MNKLKFGPRVASMKEKYRIGGGYKGYSRREVTGG